MKLLIKFEGVKFALNTKNMKFRGRTRHSTPPSKMESKMSCVPAVSFILQYMHADFANIMCGVNMSDTGTASSTENDNCRGDHHKQ